MQVILQESYMNLGEAGDVINVKPGYARNFLIPEKIAVSATTANLRRSEDKKKELDTKKEQERSKSAALLEKLKETSITLKKRVGDDGKLYGSVTSKDLEEALAAQGAAVDRRMIVMGQQIKMTGDYEIMVKLVGGKKTTVPLKVEAEESKKEN